MFILLPPSEGKTPPMSGPCLDMSGLSFTSLTSARQQLASELIDVAASPNALDILGVGERTRHEVEAQRDLFSLPCAPARDIYTGVLYEAAQLRSDDEVFIFSGLFGITSGEDYIPAYRLSMNVNLPGAGKLSTFWRTQLKEKLNTHENALYDPTAVYVDMRSGAYQVWNPPGIWWDVRILSPQGKVISHMAKHYRGILTRALLDARSEEIADVARVFGEVNVEAKGRRRHLTLRLSD